jgi:hypothetical protein
VESLHFSNRDPGLAYLGYP